jgi:hypothetical protein
MPKEDTQFKKGWKGGPGRPSISPELKKIPGITKEEVDKILAKFSRMSRDEIKAFMADPTATMMELMVGSVVLKAYQHGDQNRLGFIFDRTIGKVKEVKEIQLPKPTLIERENGQQILLGATMDEVTDGDD